MNITFIFLSSLALVLQITPCSGTAKLMIRFDSFQNTGFLKEDGKCCDGESRNGNCTGQCDYGVNICLSRNATGDPCQIETFDVGSVDVDTSSFNFPLTFISGFANPLPITLDSWQGDIIVTITIYDADTEREERVDSFNFTYTKQEPISSRSVVRGDFQDYTLAGKRSILPTRLDAAVAVQCDRFFYGEDCSINCVENDDCNGHYTCNPINGAKICNEGWSGDNCSISVSEDHGCFSSQQCANSAECIRYGDSSSDFYCCCAPGFTGDNCEIDVDECASSPCENGGSCTQDEPNSYACACPIRFKGQKCEIQRTCDDNPCLNGGDCRPVFGSFFCICDPRFAGDVCETLITTTPATTTPACPVNFYGPSCSVYCEGRDDCGGHYTCDIQDGNRICNPTWGGVNCTERTISDATCPCQNGGQCFQSQCCCPQEFAGSLCEFRIRCTADRCLNGGQCYEEANGFRCECARGFTGENCETELTTPDPAAACPTDYFGPTCSEFCRPQEDCNAGQWNCHPMTGERLCRFGWRGEFCNQRDPRAQHDVICPNSQCRNGGICTNSTCCCPIGYTGSLCHIEILECASNPCRNSARCEDLIGDYLCVCSQGYTGRNCEIYIGGSITTQEPDPCMSINCQNGGTCVSNSSSETICLCPEGFRGDLCAETTPRPSATPGCPENYYGPNCLTYCKEEDTCEGGHYYCDPSSGRKLCKSGWIGTICNSRVLLQEIDPECPAVGCKNQGQCFNGSCCCHATSRGEYCQEEILACTRNPCGNGGTCKDLTNGYNCSCSPGYSGINCETFIGFPPGYSSTTASSVSTGSSTSTLESCDEVKCLNGGFCVHVVLPFSCVCIYPFSGEYCEIDMSITTTTDSGIVTGQTPTSVIRTIYLRGNVSDSSQAALEQIIQAALNRSIDSSSCCPLVYILQKTTYMGPRGDIIVGYVYNFTQTGGSVISGMTPEELNNFSNEVDIGLQRTNPFNQNGVLVYRGPTPSLVNLRYTYTVDFVGDIPESRRQSVIADIEAAWRNANPDCRCTFSADIVQTVAYTGDYGTKVSRVYYTITRDGRFQDPSTVQPPTRQVFFATVLGVGSGNAIYTGTVLIPYNRRHSVLINSVVDMGSPQGSAITNDIRSAWIRWRDTDPSVPPNLRNAPLEIIPVRAQKYYTQDGVQMTKVEYFVQLGNTYIVGPEATNVSISGPIYCTDDNCKAVPVPFVDVKGRLTSTQLQILGNRLNPADTTGVTISSEQFINSDGEPVTRVYYMPPISGTGVQSTAIGQARLTQILTDLNLQQPSRPADRSFSLYFAGGIGDNNRTAIEQTIINAWAGYLGISPSVLSVNIDSMNDSYVSTTSDGRRTRVTQVMYTVSIQGSDSQWTRYEGVEPVVLSQYITLPLVLVQGEVTSTQGETTPTTGSSTTETTTSSVTPTGPAFLIQTIYLKGNISDGSQNAVEAILLRAFNSSMNASFCCLRLYIIEQTNYIDPNGNLITGYRYNISNSTGSPLDTMTPEQTTVFTNLVNNDLQRTEPFLQTGAIIFTGSVQILRPIEFAYTVDFIGDIPDSWRQAVIDAIEAAWEETYPGDYQVTIVRMTDFTGDYGIKVTRVYYTTTSGGQIQDPNIVTPPSSDVFTNVLQQDSDVNEMYSGSSLLPYNRHHSVLLTRVVDMDSDQGVMARNAIESGWINWRNTNSQVPPNLRNAPLRIVLLRPETYYTQDGRQLTNIRYLVLLNNTIVIGPQTANITLNNVIFCNCEALPVPFVDVKGQLTISQLQTLASSLNPSDVDGRTTNTEVYRDSLGGPVTRVYYRPPISGPDVLSTAVSQQRLDQILTNLNLEQYSSPMTRVFTTYFGGRISSNSRDGVQQSITDAWASALGVPSSEISTDIITMDDNYFSTTSNTQVTQVTYSVSLQGADSRWTQFVGINAGTLGRYLNSTDLYIVGGAIIRAQGGTVSPGETTPTTMTVTGVVTVRPTATTQTIFLTGIIREGSQPSVEEILQNALNNSNTGSSCCLRLYIIETTSYLDPSGNIITGYTYNVTNSTSGTPVTMTPEQTNNFTIEVGNEFQKSDPFRETPGGVAIYTGSVQGLRNTGLTYTVDFIGDLPQSRTSAVLSVIEEAWQQSNPGCGCQFEATMVQTQEYTGDYGTTVNRVFYTMARDGVIQEPSSVQPPSQAVLLNTVQGDTNVNSLYIGGVLLPRNRRHSLLLNRVVDIDGNDGRILEGIITTAWLNWIDLVLGNLRDAPVRVVLLRPQTYYTQDGTQLSMVPYYVIVNNTIVLGQQTANLTITGSLVCDDCDALPVPFVDVKGQLTFIELETFASYLNPFDRNGSTINTETFLNTVGEEVTRVYYRPPITSPEVTSTAINPQRLTEVLEFLNIEQPSRPIRRTFNMYFGGSIDDSDISTIEETIRNAWASTLGIPANAVSVKVDTMDDSYFSGTSNTQVTRVTYRVSIQGADSHWTRFMGLDAGTLTPYFTSPDLYIVGGTIIRTPGGTLPPGQTPSTVSGVTTVTTGPTTATVTTQTIYLTGNISDGTQPAVEEILRNALNASSNGASCCLRLYIIERTSYIDPSGVVVTGYRYNVTNSTSGMPVTLTPEQTTNFTREVNNDIQKSDPLLIGGVYVYTNSIQGLKTTDLAYTVDLIGRIPESRQKSVLDAIEQAWQDAFPDCRCVFTATMVQKEELSGDYGITVSRVYYTVTRDGQPQDPNNVAAPSRQDVVNAVQQDSDMNQVYPGSQLIPYNQRHGLLLNRVVDMDSTDGTYVRNAIQTAWIDWRNTDPSVPNSLRNADVNILMLKPLKYYTQDGRQISKIEYFVLLNNTVVIGPQRANVTLTDPLFCDCEAVPVPFVDVEGELTPVQTQILGVNLNPLDTSGVTIERENFVDTNGGPVTRVYYRPPITGPGVQSTGVSQQRLNQILTSLNLQQPSDPLEKSFLLYIGGRITDNDRDNIQRTIRNAWSNTYNLPADAISVNVISLNDSFISTPSNTPATQVRYTVTITDADSYWTRFDGVDSGTLGRYFTPTGYTVIQEAVINTQVTTAPGGTTPFTGVSVTPTTPTGTTNFVSVIYLRGNISDSNQAAVEELLQNALNKTRSGSCCIKLYIIEKTTFLDSSGGVITGYRFNASNGTAPVVLTPEETSNFTNEVNNGLQTSNLFQGIVIYQGPIQGPTETYSIDFIGDIPETEQQAVVTDIERAWMNSNPDCRCVFQANIVNMDEFSGDFGIKVTRVYYTITKDGLVQEPKTVTPPSRQIFYNIVQGDNSINSIYSGTTLIPYSQHHNVLLSKVVDMNSDEGRQVLDQIRSTWITWRNTSPAVPENLRQAPIEIKLLRPLIYYTQDGRQLTKLEYFVISNSTNVIGPQQETDGVTFTGPLFCDDCDAIPVPFVEVKGRLSPAQIQTLGFNLNPSDGSAVNTEMFFNSKNEPVTRVYYRPPISGPDVTSTAVSQQRLNQVLTNQNLEQPSLPSEKSFTINIAGRTGNNNRNAIIQILKNLWVATFNIPSDSVSIDVKDINDNYVSSASGSPVTQVTYTVDIQGADSRWTQYEGLDPATLGQYFQSLGINLVQGDIIRIEGRTTPTSGTGQTTSPTSPTGRISTVSVIILRGNISDSYQTAVEELLQNALNRTKNGPSCCIQLQIIEQSTVFDPNGGVLTSYRFNATNSSAPVLLTPEEIANFTNEVSNGLQTSDVLQGQGIVIYQGPVQGPTDTYSVDFVGDIPETRKEDVVRDIERAWLNTDPDCRCVFNADVVRTDEFSGDFGIKITRVYYRIRRDGLVQDPKTVMPPSRQVFYDTVQGDDSINSIYSGTTLIPYSQHHNVFLSKVVDMNSDEGRQVLDQIRSTWITWRNTSPAVPENLRQAPVEIRLLRPLIYYTQDGRQVTKLEYFVILNGTIVIAPQPQTDSVTFTGPLFCNCDAIPVPFIEVKGRLSPSQLTTLGSNLNPSGGSVTMSEVFISSNNEPVTRVYYSPPISGPDVTSTAVSQETLDQILTNQNLELPTLPTDKSFTLNFAGRIGDNDRNVIQRTIQSVWGTTFNIPSNSLAVDIKSMDDSYVSSTSNTPVTQVIYTVAIQGADSRWTQYEGVDPGVLGQYFRSSGLTLVQGNVERTTRTTSGTGSTVTQPTPTGTTNLDGVIYLTGNISNNEQAALEEVFKSALNKTKNGPACCIDLYIIERTNYLDPAGNIITGYRYNATNGSTPIVLTPTERDNFTREVNNEFQTSAPFRGRGIQVYRGSVQALKDTYTIDFIGEITQAERGAVTTDIERAWLSVNPDCGCLFKANITKMEALSGDFGTVVTRVYYTITKDGLVQDPKTVTPPSRQVFYNTVQGDDSINSIYSGTTLIPYSQHHNVFLSKVMDMNSVRGKRILDLIRYAWITWRNADQAVPESLRNAPLEIRLLRPQLYYTTNGTQLTKLEYFVILNNTTVIGPQSDTERVSLRGPEFCDCKAIPVPFIEVKGLLSSDQLQALGSSLNPSDGSATISELFITSEDVPVTRVYYLPQISGPDVTSTAVSSQRLNQILTSQNLEEPTLPTDKTFTLNFEGRVGSDKIPQIEQTIKNLWIGTFDIPSDAVSVNVENLDDDYVSSSNNPVTRLTYTVSIRGADSKWTRFEGVDPARYFTSSDLNVFGGEITRGGSGTSSSTTSTTAGPMYRVDDIYLKGDINNLDQPVVESVLQRAMDRINSGSSCCLKVDILARTAYANPDRETVIGYRYNMTNSTGGTVSELTPEQRRLLTNELNRELQRVPQFRWNGVTVYSGSYGDLRNLGSTYGIDITGTVTGTQNVVDVIEESWKSTNPECGCQFKADIFLTKQLSGDYGMVVTRVYYTITRDGQTQSAETVPSPSREVISAAIDNDKKMNPLYFGSTPIPYDQHHSVVLNRVVDMTSEEGQGVVRTLQTEWKKWQNTDSTVPDNLRAQPLEILLLRPQKYYTQAGTTVTNVEYFVKLGERYLIGPDISINLSGGIFCDCEAIPVPFLDVKGQLQWSKLLELGTSLNPADTTGSTVERNMFSEGDGEPVTRVFYRPTIENGNVQSTALSPEQLDEILTNHNLERPSLPVKKVFTFNFDGSLGVDQKSVVADGLLATWSSSLGIPTENVSVVVNDMNDNFYSTTSNDQVTQVKYTVAIQRGDSHWTRFEGVDTGMLGEKFSSTAGLTPCGCSAREGREIMVTGVVGNDTTDLENALTKAWMQANPDYTGTLTVGIKKVEGDAPTKLRYIVTPAGGPAAFTENDLTTPQDELIGNEISPLDLTVYKGTNDDSDTSDWAIPVGVVLGLLLLLIIIIVIVLVIRNRRHRMSHTLKQKPEELNGYDKQHFSDEPHFNNPTFNMEDPEISDGKQRTYIVNEEQTMEDIKLDRST